MNVFVTEMIALFDESLLRYPATIIRWRYNTFGLKIAGADYNLFVQKQLVRIVFR